MKTLKAVFMAMVLVLMSSLLLTCKKENVKSVATDQEVAFAINISNLINASMLKSTMGYNLADADKIILTIQFCDGGPTKYTNTEIKIQQMNGVYYTQKIVLKTDNYKLTEFLILNATDSTIFVAPLTGSQEAQNVSSPLPIEFSAAKDITTPVNVEVLSTEKKKPEDFGLNRFPIIEVKTFGFMIGVADSESDKLLSAKLTISNGSYSYIQNLDSVTNNVVTVKDGLSNYTLKVEKSGYKTYTHAYSMDSLKMYKDSTGNLPLLVELEKLSLNFTDGFEDNSLNNYWTIFSTGQAAISTEQSHTGLHSIKLTGVQGSLDATFVSHDYTALMKGRVSVWLYDTFAGQYGPYCKLNCYNTAIPNGNMGNVFAMGIDDWQTNWYDAGSSIEGVTTGINRTVGWHKMEIYFGNSHVEFFIDNTLVYTVPGEFNFNKVELFAGYHNGSFYFDDFSVNAD
jgi:hypothetical protein